MSACNLTQYIDPSECIGDSLTKINTGFDKLDTAVCTLSTNLNTTTSTLNALESTVVNDITAKTRFLTLSAINTFYVNGSTSPQSWRSSVTVSPGNDTTAIGTPTAPFKTLSACAEFLYNKRDLGGGGAEIRLCAGSYRGAFFRGNSVGSNSTSASLQGTPDPDNPQSSVYLTIAGNSNNDTYICQWKLYDFGVGDGSRWAHIYVEDARIDINNVTFRYNPSVGGTFIASNPKLSIYNQLLVWNSICTCTNVVFEAQPMVVATPVGGTGGAANTLTSAVIECNRSDLYINTCTINNVLNGLTNSNSAIGRYFIIGTWHSFIHMAGTLTLLNGPRFAKFIETNNYSTIWQTPAQYWTGLTNTTFTWSGGFGTRLGSGTNRAFPANGYESNQVCNYLYSNDGPWCRSYTRATSLPANSLEWPYAASRDATVFNFVQTW